MIVGALRDCGQINGRSDLKADRHICRVLGRAVIGKTTDAASAAELARRLYAADPWQLDWPLWNVGKSYCHANHPSCSPCYLAALCSYATNLHTGMLGTEVPEAKIAPEIPQVSYDEAKARFARALSVTTYNSANPRFLYFEFEKGKYEKVPFIGYAPWIEKLSKVSQYPEWRLKHMD